MTYYQTYKKKKEAGQDPFEVVIPGRKRKTTPRTDNVTVRMAKKNPRITLRYYYIHTKITHYFYIDPGVFTDITYKVTFQRVDPIENRVHNLLKIPKNVDAQMRT